MMQVPVIGKEDKRGLTAMVANDMSGTMLPLQLIYQGKTERSLPANREEAEAAGHLFSATESHWMTLAAMQDWVEKVQA